MIITDQKKTGVDKRTDLEEEKPNMRYPEFLKENGTIGFVAPSFGCSTEPYRTAFNHALDKWKKEGDGIDIGPNC